MQFLNSASMCQSCTTSNSGFQRDTFQIITFNLYLRVCVCMCVCHMYRTPQRPKEGVGSLGVGVTGDGEPPTVGADK